MSEVRALLLTDVVDSTALSETLGDAEMAVLWAAHDRLARDLLPLWRGREIDKTDGMLLLFDAASDAAAYAIAYHRALATLNPPLTARAGLHVGPVILRENSPSDMARGAKPLEAEGTAKAVAARVMSIANGGQTLLSADARNALG
jgi:class 3 adenylate cyclase